MVVFDREMKCVFFCRSHKRKTTTDHLITIGKALSSNLTEITLLDVFFFWLNFILFRKNKF